MQSVQPSGSSCAGMPATTKKKNLSVFSGITKSSPGDNATGVVTLYVNKSDLFNEIELDTNLQAVTVRVSAKRTWTLCCVYLPPSLDINFSDLEHLIEQLPAPFVLVGDFNAQSPLWGDVRQDSRGKMIEKLLNDYNLCLLNTVNLHTDTTDITPFLFMICLSVIYLLHLNLTG